MLPKPEKTKKSQSSEQLDLVESISTEDKLKQKRRFLLITLFATVGLSFIFSAYRFFQNFSFSSINFSLPQLNLSFYQPTDNQKQLDTELNHLLSPHPERWHLSISGSNFQWSYNPLSVGQTPTLTYLGIIKSVLPEGVEIKESLNSSDPSSLQYFANISLPQGKFSIFIKSDDHDLDKFKSTIPLIVENLYWSLLKSL